jgi:hypothetical protein
MSVIREYCESCGRRVQDAEIAGICSLCGKRLCSNCVRVGVDGRYYCIDHYVPPPPPATTPTSSSRCFIATAAYGTPMAREIQVLRAFRDRRLLATRLGHTVTQGYYLLSPPVADAIRHHPLRRRVVRIILQPLIRVFERLGP